MALEKENAAFERLKPELLVHEGQFAVISGEILLGTFVAYEDALKVGYEKCGLKPFLVRRILAVEPINFFTREIVAA